MIFDNKHLIVKERVSFRSRLNASLSVEASLVLPLFLFFVITVMSLLVMAKEQSETIMELHQNALSMYESSATGDDGSMIEINKDYIQYPVIRFFSFLSVSVKDRIVMHPFTGYTGNGGQFGEKEPDEYVYVTKNGTKYHRNPSCSYINIRPHSSGAESIKEARNSYGRKYRACDVCHPKLSGLLFITGDGECYHCRSDCPALKRTVYMVTLKEAAANGYTACSKCG